MMAMNIAETEKELRGAAALVKAKSSTAKVGVVGYCMGGSLALLAATLNADIGACNTYYGANQRIKPDFSLLACPVLGLWGADDGHITPAIVGQLAVDIHAAGKTAEMHSYKGAGHAFFNDSRPEAYNKEAAQDAWKRTLTFFRKHLK